MELLTTYLELVTCTKCSRGRQICWYLSSGTKPKRQEQDFDQQRLLLAVGQHLSLDIMLCEGWGTQVKKQPSQSHTTLSQSLQASHNSHPIFKLRPFSCQHQHLYYHSPWWPQLSLWACKYHLLFLATTRADSPLKAQRSASAVRKNSNRKRQVLEYKWGRRENHQPMTGLVHYVSAVSYLEVALFEL